MTVTIVLSKGTRFEQLESHIQMASAQEQRVWAGACPRTANCIKPASHKGACKVACMEEEDYEVEKVMAQRTGPDGRVEYQVKWVGWPVEDCTWEPVSALADCKGVLREWEARNQVADEAAATEQAPQTLHGAQKAAPSSGDAPAPVAAPGLATASARRNISGASPKLPSDDVGSGETVATRLTKKRSADDLGVEIDTRPASQRAGSSKQFCPIPTEDTHEEAATRRIRSSSGVVGVRAAYQPKKLISSATLLGATSNRYEVDRIIAWRWVDPVGADPEAEAEARRSAGPGARGRERKEWLVVLQNEKSRLSHLSGCNPARESITRRIHHAEDALKALSFRAAEAGVEEGMYREVELYGRPREFFITATDSPSGPYRHSAWVEEEELKGLAAVKLDYFLKRRRMSAADAVTVEEASSMARGGSPVGGFGSR